MKEMPMSMAENLGNMKDQHGDKISDGVDKAQEKHGEKLGDKGNQAVDGAQDKLLGGQDEGQQGEQ
jgi:nucleoid-associated protein YgaU